MKCETQQLQNLPKPICQTSLTCCHLWLLKSRAIPYFFGILFTYKKQYKAIYVKYFPCMGFCAIKENAGVKVEARKKFQADKTQLRK